MSFRENYKKEMQEIKHDETLDQTILDAVKDNSIESDGVQSEFTKSDAWGQVSERGRWTGRRAAAIIAMICGIMLVVNFPSGISYADAVIGNFRLIACGSQMQLSEMTPVEIDLEKHIAYEKTELLDAPDQMSYWCTYETQDLLQENTGLLISKSDALNVQNVVVSIDTMYRTGHLSMKVVWNGKKYGMNGMFVIDGFDQDKEYGYGERSAPYYVYEYADGKKAYFVKDRDYKDLQKVYFSENGIMYQLFVEKSEEGKEIGKRIVDEMSQNQNS